MKQLHLEEGHLFNYQERRHIDRRYPNWNSERQTKREPVGTSNREDITNLQLWQYRENLGRSPWTGEIVTEPDATTKIPEWLIQLCTEQNRRVGSPAPINRDDNNQKGNTVPVEGPAKMDWDPPNTPLRKSSKTYQWVTESGQRKGPPEEKQNFTTDMKQQEEREWQKGIVQKEADNYRMWPGEPWIDSQAMSIKLAIPTEGGSWEEARYSYWGIYRQIPIMWGTMGAGCPVYYEPTSFIKRQSDCPVFYEPTCFIKEQSDKRLPILQMVLRGQLVYEQQIFNDLRIQTTKHSIHHNWSALKKDAQLQQRIAKGAMIRLGPKEQIKESQVWEPENATPIPCTWMSLEGKKEPSKKRNQQLSEEVPEGSCHG